MYTPMYIYLYLHINIYLALEYSNKYQYYDFFLH